MSFKVKVNSKEDILENIIMFKNINYDLNENNIHTEIVVFPNKVNIVLLYDLYEKTRVYISWEDEVKL